MGSSNSDLLTSFIAGFTEWTGFEIVPGSTQEEVSYWAGTRNRYLDAQARVRMPSGVELVLAIEIVGGAGYPRDVLGAQETLLRYKNNRPANERSPVALFVLAGSLSPGAREELKASQINYYDSTTSMYFRHDSCLVVREIQVGDGPKPRKRSMRLYTGAREQVVHALLEHWYDERDGFISGKDLAEKAEVSPYTVSSTMQELEREEWVVSRGSGPDMRRRLVKPAELLDEWALAWVARKEEVSRWYTWAGSNLVEDMIARLEGFDGWAITGAAAANPSVDILTTVDRLQLMVPPDSARSMAADLRLKAVQKGANVVLIERSGAAMMFQKTRRDMQRARVASRFVRYLDLLDGYGRNEELAAAYRERKLELEPRK